MTVCTVRWKHPELGSITEHLCSRHRGVVLPALSLVGIVYGYADEDDEAEECMRCRWDAPYGDAGLPPTHVRLRLESVVMAEITRELGPDPEPPWRQAIVAEQR